jgi:hypothetical protein
MERPLIVHMRFFRLRTNLTRAARLPFPAQTAAALQAAEEDTYRVVKSPPVLLRVGVGSSNHKRSRSLDGRHLLATAAPTTTSPSPSAVSRRLSRTASQQAALIPFPTLLCGSSNWPQLTPIRGISFANVRRASHPLLSLKFPRHTICQLQSCCRMHSVTLKRSSFPQTLRTA